MSGSRELQFLTVRFLYGGGAVNFGDRRLGKDLSSGRKTPKQRCAPRKPRENEVWACSAEIQTLAVDTRTVV